MYQSVQFLKLCVQKIQFFFKFPLMFHSCGNLGMCSQQLNFINIFIFVTSSSADCPDFNKSSATFILALMISISSLILFLFSFNSFFLLFSNSISFFASSYCFNSVCVFKSSFHLCLMSKHFLSYALVIGTLSSPPFRIT